jgi:hypothetical protein
MYVTAADHLSICYMMTSVDAEIVADLIIKRKVQKVQLTS